MEVSPAIQTGQKPNFGDCTHIDSLHVHFLTCLVSWRLIIRLFYDAVSVVENM